MNIVQRAVRSDGSDIDRIMSSLVNFSATDRSCVRELWEDFLQNGADSPYQFCICREYPTQSSQGFACYGKHALTEDTFDLYWIAVDAAVQRSGAGSDLLAYVEEQVLNLHGRHLIIETSSTEPYKAARAFYRRHNYLREALIRDFYAPGDHLVIYTKELTHPACSGGIASRMDPFNQEQALHLIWGQRRTRFPG